jgi:hypothetical protein
VINNDSEGMVMALYSLLIYLFHVILKMLKKINPDAFNGNLNGEETSLHFLKNNNIELAITNYGARIVTLIVPDKNQQPTDVVVGFDSLHMEQELLP